MDIRYLSGQLCVQSIYLHQHLALRLVHPLHLVSTHLGVQAKEELLLPLQAFVHRVDLLQPIQSDLVLDGLTIDVRRTEAIIWKGE